MGKSGNFHMKPGNVFGEDGDCFLPSANTGKGIGKKNRGELKKLQTHVWGVRGYEVGGDVEVQHRREFVRKESPRGVRVKCFAVRGNFGVNGPCYPPVKPAGTEHGRRSRGSGFNFSHHLTPALFAVQMIRSFSYIRFVLRRIRLCTRSLTAE